MSKASELALALSQRVATITKANGYLTDIGLRVFRGKGKLDESELPCIVIVEGDERIDGAAGTDAKVIQRYVFEGHDACDADQPNDKGHEIIADLKRALFSGDRTFGGRVRPVGGLAYAGRRINPRDDGTALISATVDIDCQISENLTNP